MEVSKGAPVQVRFDTLAKPGDLLAFSALLDACFDASSYLDDFPVWNEKRADLMRIGAWDGATLAACAAARMARLKTPTGSLSIGLVGAVATHPDYRGRGLASRAVQLAVEWLQARHVAVAVLWGSELELYGRLGFDLCGTQAAVSLDSMELPRAVRYTGNVEKGWVPGIFGLLQDRSEGLVLGNEDLSWLQSHRNVKWYWAGSKGRPEAYAAIGRGIDLQNCVHEWGGDPAALSAVLARVRSDHPDAVLLSSPRILNGLASQLGVAPDSAVSQFLCLARVLDPKQVLLEFGVSIDPPPEDFSLARLFFGPSAAIGAGSAHFPLPLWLWGLDSA